MAEHSIIEGISLSENCSSESEGETSRGRKVLQLVESVAARMCASALSWDGVTLS